MVKLIRVEIPVADYKAHLRRTWRRAHSRLDKYGLTSMTKKLPIEQMEMVAVLEALDEFRVIVTQMAEVPDSEE